MSNLKEVQGYYGVNRPNPTTILVYEKRNGSSWYCVEGSKNVNLTYDEISTGTNVEELQDVDTFTWNEPINTLEELETAVED